MRAAPAATRRKAGHIQRLLEPGAIRPVYQPIVRLGDLEPVGYEGLARFPYADGLSHLPPDVTLAAAAELGLREDLEAACWAAMADAGSPPDGRLLFVNISPEALEHPRLLELADRLPSRLVIEITEQSEVSDYGQLRELLEPWVSRGAAVAIDDTGAGYASLQHVVELRPDFLKLTRSLVADIDRDANRQALLRALAAFARQVGAGIVAEGVERVEELEVLREAKVDYAQGWLFGRPGPPWPSLLEVGSDGRDAGLTESGVRRLDGLERSLAAARAPLAACEAVVEHLRGQGLMPSVYLAQGGRLRCMAAHGYWTVYDGMPPEAGVIGRCYRSGEPVLISDVAAASEYLSLISSVQADLAVPLRVGESVVGVLNVESGTPLGDGPCRETVRAAELLGRRLAELGPLDRPSAAQRLARAAARTAAMDDPTAVLAEALAAATQVAGLESAAIALRDGNGRLEVCCARGPFADAFRALDGPTLAAVAAWVDQGTSARTMGDLSGKAPVAVEPLRQAGAGTMVVVPLSLSGARLGFVALADRSTLLLDVETIELLELLGVQAAAQLRGLAAVDQLRDRAARDPLTGLAHQAALNARLARSRQLATAQGRTIGVVLADIDGMRALNERRGQRGGDEILRAMAAMLEEAAGERGSAFRVGGDEFALVIEADGRHAAQEVAWQLQSQARERLGATLSIGVAVAAEAESESGLLARADAALGEVKRRGRDGVALAPAPDRSAG
jgi:diguanylate cyclase (GGDEF)-like protein